MIDVEITCPACRKVNPIGDAVSTACGRCGCELTDLVLIADAAFAQLQASAAAFRAGNLPLALGHAGRSWSLRRSSPAAAAAALAAAALGDATALSRWRARWLDACP